MAAGNSLERWRQFLKYLFDTNAVIIALDGRNAAFHNRLAQIDEGDVVISSIVLAEVAHGTVKGKAPLAEVLDVFLEDVPALPFDQRAAMKYAKLPFRRGSFDRLIAAHAIALELTLVTANVADFADIPELRVEDWTA